MTRPGEPAETGNELEVGQETLAAEAEGIALPGGAELEQPTSAAPGTELAPAPPASWAPITPAIVEGVDLFVCPAWELTADEKRALADALAPALDQLFPGGIGDERWAPYFRVLVVAGGIVALRYDRKSGKLRPLKSKPTSSSPDSSAPQLGAGEDQGGAATAAAFSTAPGA